jgi:hypothetical protein
MGSRGEEKWAGGLQRCAAGVGASVASAAAAAGGAINARAYAL